MGGGGSKVPASTTTTQEPWGEQRPFLVQGFQRADHYLNGAGPDYYPGQTYGGLSGQSQAAINQTFDNGANMSPLIQQTLGGALGNFSAGQQQMIDNNIRAATPGIQSGFAANGRLGSGAEANALSDSAARTVQNAQMGYAQMLPSLMDSQNTMMTSAGAALDQNTQNIINAEMERWNFNANRDVNKLANYMQIIQGNYGGTNTSTMPIYSNPAMQTMGGVVGGLGALGSLGQGVGALTGSDIRMKENIERVGTLNNGLGVYSYNYKGSDKPQIGLLAQEVAASKPEAVGHIGEGLLGVDYGKAVQ